MIEQPNFIFTTVSYNDLLNDPLPQLAGVTNLLGRPLDTQAMSNAIELWCSELEDVLSEFWFQWFVFEPVFTEIPGEK